MERTCTYHLVQLKHSIQEGNKRAGWAFAILFFILPFVVGGILRTPYFLIFFILGALFGDTIHRWANQEVETDGTIGFGFESIQINRNGLEEIPYDAIARFTCGIALESFVTTLSGQYLHRAYLLNIKVNDGREFELIVRNRKPMTPLLTQTLDRLSDERKLTIRDKKGRIHGVFERVNGYYSR